MPAAARARQSPSPPFIDPPGYGRHRPERTLLYQLVEQHYPTFRELRAAADAIVDWQPPLLTFKAIVGASLACNPGPHVTDVGITDGSTGAIFASALVRPGEVDALTRRDRA